jgi:hypothetical protein
MKESETHETSSFMTTKRQERRQQQKANRSSKQSVCFQFRSGKCKREDCKFSHEEGAQELSFCKEGEVAICLYGVEKFFDDKKLAAFLAIEGITNYISLMKQRGDIFAFLSFANEQEKDQSVAKLCQIKMKNSKRNLKVKPARIRDDQLKAYQRQQTNNKRPCDNAEEGNLPKKSRIFASPEDLVTPLRLMSYPEQLALKNQAICDLLACARTSLSQECVKLYGDYSDPRDRWLDTGET